MRRSITQTFTHNPLRINDLSGSIDSKLHGLRYYCSRSSVANSVRSDKDLTMTTLPYITAANISILDKNKVALCTTIGD